MKILLVSHGDFAQGLCSTLTNFFGAKNVYSACVTLENGTADLLDGVQSYLDQWGPDEQVVICSDLLGGSANQAVYPYISRPNTFLVAGMNLPLVLLLHLESEVTADSLRGIIAQACEGIGLVNDMDFGTMDEDDE